jgi:hypothetical protein
MVKLRRKMTPVCWSQNRSTSVQGKRDHSLASRYLNCIHTAQSRILWTYVKWQSFRTTLFTGKWLSTPRKQFAFWKLVPEQLIIPGCAIAPYLHATSSWCHLTQEMMHEQEAPGVQMLAASNKLGSAQKKIKDQIAWAVPDSLAPVSSLLLLTALDD